MIIEQYGVRPFPLPRKLGQLFVQFQPPSKVLEDLARIDTTASTLHRQNRSAAQTLWSASKDRFFGILCQRPRLRNLKFECTVMDGVLSGTFDSVDRELALGEWNASLKELGLAMPAEACSVDAGTRVESDLSRIEMTREGLFRFAADHATPGSRLASSVLGEDGRWYALTSAALRLIPEEAVPNHWSASNPFARSLENGSLSERVVVGEEMRRAARTLSATNAKDVLAAALAVAEALFYQRDSWQSGNVILADGTPVSIRPQWLRVERRALADWLRAGSPGGTEPARSRVRAAIHALAWIAQTEPPRESTARQRLALLDAVVDGRELRTSREPLANTLRSAGVDTDDAFYVRLSRNFVDAYFTPHEDGDGQVRWGHSALGAITRDTRLSQTEKADLKRRIKGNTYITFYPAVVHRAARAGVKGRALALLLSLLLEQRGGMPPSSDEPALTPLNGREDRGYQAAVRMRKSSYPPGAYGQPDQRAVFRQVALVRLRQLEMTRTWYDQAAGALAKRAGVRGPDERPTPLVLETRHLRATIRRVGLREFELLGYPTDLDWAVEVIRGAASRSEVRDSPAGEHGELMGGSWVVPGEAFLRVSVSELGLLEAHAVWTDEQPPEHFEPFRTAFWDLLASLDPSASAGQDVRR